jgi:hypothetical protein
MSDSTETLKWYAHVAEIVDRIIIESLKVGELMAQMMETDDSAIKDRFLRQIGKASTTAELQRDVLRKRLAEYDETGAVADLVTAVISAAVDTSVVARFENMKRKEQALEQSRNVDNIVAWDDISRDACEGRASAKAAINRAIRGLFPNYTYPAEARTF